MGCSMKNKIRNILMISFLAVAGIFGVSKAVINIMAEGNINRAEASGTQANTIGTYIFLIDEARDVPNVGAWTDNNKSPHVQLRDVVFDSNSPYSSSNLPPNGMIGDWTGTTDGYLTAKMGWDSDDGSKKKYKITIPWYVVSFTAAFYSGSSNNKLAYVSGGAEFTRGMTRGNYYNVYASKYNNSASWGNNGWFYCSPSAVVHQTGWTYTETTYTVSYNLNGGSGTFNPQTALKGAKISDGTPTRSGYRFINWTVNSTSGADFSTNTGVTADMTLYAKWSQQLIIFWFTPKSSFESNHSDFVRAYIWHDSSKVAPAGWPGYALTEDSLVKETDDGYYYQITVNPGSGSGQYDTSKRPDKVIFNDGNGHQTGNLDLSCFDGTQYYRLGKGTEGWCNYEVSITYKDQGDAAFSGTHEEGYPTVHYYGDEDALDEPTRTGYRFLGYYDNANCLGNPITSIDDEIYEAITVYALWESGEEAAQTFVGGFNSAIGTICASYNTNTKASFLTNWNSTQEVAYNTLEEYQLYWLNVDNASSDAYKNAINAMLSRYDYILSKYGYGDGNTNLHDFLSRTPAPRAAIDFSPLSLFIGGEDNLSTVIIIVSSSVALLSITALSILVIKKRKNKEE